MSSRERIQMILAGERPDRYALSCWRHFFETEHDREKNLDILLGFQQKYQWDFVKLNSPADYHVEGWGVQVEHSRKETVKHRKLNYPVTDLDDWQKIKPIPITAKPLNDELWKLSRMRKALGAEVPILMTIFSPLAIAARMVENENVLLSHLDRNHDVILSALESITATFEQFVLETRNAGADGIFFATSHWATKQKFSWPDYERYFLPFDRRVMAATGADAQNMLHLCDRETMLLEFANAQFPARMINWNTHDPSNPPLDKGVEILPNMTCVGGLDHDGWLLRSEPDEVAWLAGQMMKKYDPARVIFAPGCTLDPATPMRNLDALRETIGK